MADDIVIPKPIDRRPQDLPVSYDGTGVRLVDDAVEHILAEIRHDANILDKSLRDLFLRGIYNVLAANAGGVRFDELRELESGNECKACGHHERFHFALAGADEGSRRRDDNGAVFPRGSLYEAKTPCARAKQRRALRPVGLTASAPKVRQRGCL